MGKVSCGAVLAATLIAYLGFLLALPARPSPWLVVVAGLGACTTAGWRLSRRRGTGLGAWIRAYPDVAGLTVVMLYALGVQLADTHGITTDGVTYFTQLRSLVFDGDLDVAREYAYLNQPPRANHVVPVGPLLIWSPLYLAVALVDGMGRGVGLWSTPADPVAVGLGLPYVRAALLSSFALGAAGLVAILLFLRARFSPLVAFVATLLTFAATPLYWYMVYEPSMTHAASFGFVALFIVAASAWCGAGRDPVTRRHALLLGTLLGLAFLARSQEALFAIYPGLLVLSAAGVAGHDRVRSAVRLAGWALLGALPWIVLQLLHSYVLFSRYEYQLLGQGGYFNPWQSRWIDTLFSSWHGFLSWAPVVYVAVIGTVAYLWRDWRWAASGLVILFLTAWVNGATLDWSGGWSFGGRRFTSALVMLAPGLALLIEWALRRPIVAMAPLVIAALWWNHLLMVQYTAGMLPKDEPVAFGRIVRQQAELHTRSPYWYPFAFPANVWFAWREGVPVDKYDVLSPVTPAPSFSLTFDRVAERYLLSGWDVPGGDDWGPCWWIGGSPATLAVPLAPDGGDITVTVRTRTRLEEPAVRARLAVVVNGDEIGQLTAGLPGASSDTFVIPAARARSLVRRGFNQLSFRSLGVDAVDPADTRAPTAAAERWRRGVWPVAVYSVEVSGTRPARQE